MRRAQRSFSSGALAQLLVRSLTEQGVKHIFGIPGEKIMPTFDVLDDMGPKVIVCRHEQNADKYDGQWCREASKHQAEKVFANVEGTLPGFRSPTYAQGIGVAGFHLHFLRQDKQAGGHALDYRLRAGKVQVCTVHDLRIELPTSAEFLKTNFEDQALNEKIKAAEG